MVYAFSVLKISMKSLLPIKTKLREIGFKLQVGLTLIELLVVIAILLILFLLAFIAYPNQIAKAHDAKRKEQLFRYRFALEDYFDDNGCYPIELPDCGEALVGPDGSPTYLASAPCDPQTHGVYVYERDEMDCPKWFRLFANLENTSDPDIATVGCTIGCGPGGDTSYNFGVSSTNVTVGSLSADEGSPTSGILTSPSPSPSVSPSPSPSPSVSPSPSSSPLPSGSPFICSYYYGCRSGECVLFGEERPDCAPNFCESDCQEFCGTPQEPKNECL